MLTAKIDPFARDIEVLVNSALSPAAQSAALADFARGVEKETEDKNKSALGYAPPHETFVDGSEGADEDAVKPDGTIVYEFDLLDDLFIFIDELLIQHSPVKSGVYAKSHAFFADGQPFDPTGSIPAAGIYTVANTQPYARKIEGTGGKPPESKQAPNGVYEGVATLARQRFGNVAKIEFNFTAINGGAIGAYAATPAAHRNAARHKRYFTHEQEWLTRQPSIIITVR